MTPLKIGACLAPHEIAAHRDWLFDADRDLELQGFSQHADLTTDFEDRIAAANTALARDRWRCTRLMIVGMRTTG